MERRSQRRQRATGLVVIVILAVSSCTGSESQFAPAPGPSTSAPAPSSSETPNVTGTASPHPVSLPALIAKRFDGRDFKVGRVLARAGAYTRYAITYEGGGLTLSGIMNVPSGKGPFPALVLNHGHQDIEIYTSGRGLRREQDYLARRGYVVVHPDFRNHAASDDDSRNELNLRIGYTEDVVNAVYALRAARLPYVDLDRVGMLGRSMGGGITLNAAIVDPDLVKAVVLYAPVSSNYIDNFNRWIASQDERRQLAERIVAEYGSPQTNPEFWRNISAINFLSRVAVPIQVHHGTNDERVPIAWTQRTVTALKDLGKDVQLFTYNDRHEFGPAFTTSIRRTADFFDEHLKR